MATTSSPVTKYRFWGTTDSAPPEKEENFEPSLWNSREVESCASSVHSVSDKSNDMASKPNSQQHSHTRKKSISEPFFLLSIQEHCCSLLDLEFNRSSSMPVVAGSSKNNTENSDGSILFEDSDRALDDATFAGKADSKSSGADTPPPEHKARRALFASDDSVKHLTPTLIEMHPLAEMYRCVIAAPNQQLLSFGINDCGLSVRATRYRSDNTEDTTDVVCRTYTPNTPAKKFTAEHLKMSNAEAEIHHTLEHPNIVRFLGMEYGSSELSELSELNYFTVYGGVNPIDLMKDKPRDIAAKMLIDYTEQLASALDYLQKQQILHRDIKPGNLVTTEQRIQIIDFNCAVDLKRAPNPTDSTGTIFYIAPETRQEKEQDCRADHYSLGITLAKIADELGFMELDCRSTERRTFGGRLLASPSTQETTKKERRQSKQSQGNIWKSQYKDMQFKAGENQKVTLPSVTLHPKKAPTPIKLLHMITLSLIKMNPAARIPPVEILEMLHDRRNALKSLCVACPPSAKPVVPNAMNV